MTTDVLTRPTAGAPSAAPTRAREPRWAQRARSAVESLSRFASDREASRAPLGLIAPLSVADWIALDVDERRARIAQKVTEQHRERYDRGRVERAARLAEHEARMRTAVAASRRLRRSETTDRPAMAPRSTAVVPEEARPARWLVSCAHGCGAFLPAPGPAPVLRYCAAGLAERSARSRREQRQARRERERAAESY